MDDIRILIVEDSPTVRHYLTMLINAAPDMKVVGYADNGEDAVSMVQKLRPHVVSMDINLPRLNGLHAIRRIMVRCPTPVVVVSGLLDDDIALSLQALEAGALAVVGKPPNRDNPAFEASHRQLINTLRAMAHVSVVARRERLQESPASSSASIGEDAHSSTDATRQFASSQADTSDASSASFTTIHAKPVIVAIAASTGGPSALQRILSRLSGSLMVPVVIVQHMPTEFIEGLGRWLSQASPMPVQIAYDGMILQNGTVVIAPGDVHLMIQRYGYDLMARLVHDRGGHRHQPSADVLFSSIAKTCGSAAIGVILTGMGDDGALGLEQMHQAGAYTLAQDRSTATVFGMPAAAIERGAVEKVIALEKIPSEILKLV